MNAYQCAFCSGNAKGYACSQCIKKYKLEYGDDWINTDWARALIQSERERRNRYKEERRHGNECMDFNDPANAETITYNNMPDFSNYEVQTLLYQSLHQFRRWLISPYLSNDERLMLKNELDAIREIERTKKHVGSKQKAEWFSVVTNEPMSAATYRKRWERLREKLQQKPERTL